MYAKLVDYYKDNPHVEVIIDRRTGPDRRSRKPPIDVLEKRQTRDRRRQRVTGTFPPVDLPDA